MSTLLAFLGFILAGQVAIVFALLVGFASFVLILSIMEANVKDTLISLVIVAVGTVASYYSLIGAITCFIVTFS